MKSRSSFSALFEEAEHPLLYLAPMAGVTDVVFRSLCKEMGAEVMVTEFVSAEGILQADQRTRKYTEFTEEQRPVGVQLFGADGKRMGEAARKIVDWKAPDFIDLNFGCPVKKVVSKNGGSSLLKNCPLLKEVAREVVKAMEGHIPVTAKIRIGWDTDSINALEVGQILEDAGIAALAIHGRTRSQGYSGEADWTVIEQCAEALEIPVVGNGDLGSLEDIVERGKNTRVRGFMIGRAAMSSPWIFKQARHFFKTGERLAAPNFEERVDFILRHTELSVASGLYGNERQTLMAMRSRLMAYTKSFPRAKRLRVALSQVSSIVELEGLLQESREHEEEVGKAVDPALAKA